MSISEKLDIIAENQYKVYDAGYAAGQATCGGGGDTDAAYNEGFEAGKKSEYDAFWDAFQLDRNAPSGHRLHYNSAFAYAGWTDANYNPKYPITPSNTNGIGNMFTWNQKVTDTKVPITAFGNCSNAFNQANKIKRIPKLIFSSTTNVSNMFNGCTALEELYCEGELAINGLNLSACTKLSKASIESIIGVLSDTTSGLSITLSQIAVDNAFGDGTEFSGTDGPEWGGLIETKSNWTINLV